MIHSRQGHFAPATMNHQTQKTHFGNPTRPTHSAIKLQMQANCCCNRIALRIGTRKSPLGFLRAGLVVWVRYGFGRDDLILAAIHAERVDSPRSASSFAHSVGGRLMLDVVTVRPLPLPGLRPAPGRVPPLVFGFMLVDCVGIGGGSNPAQGSIRLERSPGKAG